MIDSAFFFLLLLLLLRLRLRLRFGHEYPFSCFMVSRVFGMVFFFRCIQRVGFDWTITDRFIDLVWICMIRLMILILQTTTTTTTTTDLLYDCYSMTDI